MAPGRRGREPNGDGRAARELERTGTLSGWRSAPGSARLSLHGPAARAALLRGMQLMTALLRPTLGPLARTVAVAPFSRSQPPEILDSGATIARRTVELADPFENM